ncbi:MAG: PEP-CTERM sorting domain-containing protein [Verrucomicrobiales bacterium]|jgi:hypothetical protein|nr:PEP-CTERM sorting domain-containing protein [Verrucomicrobiales bacterium]
MKNIKRLIQCAILLALATATPVHATQYTWINTSGTSDWFDAGNWSPSSVPPTGSDDVFIGNLGYSGTAVIASGTAYSGSAVIGGNNDGAVIIDHARWDVSGTGGINIGAYDANVQSSLIINDGMVQASRLVLAAGVSASGLLEIGGQGQGQIVDGNGNALAVQSGQGRGTILFTHSGTANFANQVVGSGSGAASSSNIDLQQSGPGTTILSGSAGIVVDNITVSAGNLLVENHAGAVGSVEVRQGLLGGHGVIASLGTIHIYSGAHLSTTLKVVGTLVLEDGAWLDYAENSPLSFLYSDSVTVGVSLTGLVTVDFSKSQLVAGNDYVIIDFLNATTPSADLGGQFIANGVEGAFSIENNQLVFHATAVPEPSGWLLLGIGLTVIGLTRLHRGART